MSDDVIARRAVRLILTLVGVSTAFYILSAAIVLIAGIDLYSGSWFEQLGAQRMSLADCERHGCGQASRSIATAYIVHGSYSLLFIFAGLLVGGRHRNFWKERKATVKFLLGLIALDIVPTWIGAGRLELEGSATSLLREYSVWMFGGALVHIFFNAAIAATAVDAIYHEPLRRWAAARKASGKSVGPPA